ncbi:MAG: DUF4838 domain-containing protein [Lachnospiraceae bacterium]|nr:DUF4838 domain-containing protein [Lachnospiraceae bacterium]
MQTSILIHPDELSESWIRRMVQCGVTTLGIHPRGGRWSEESLRDLLAQLKTPAYRALLDRAAEAGLTIAYEFHAAAYLLPRELFDAHPEYFREDENGIRVRDRNFCVSNPEALDIVSERAAEAANALYRSGNEYHFWLDDGRDLSCHCPKCRAYSASDQQLLVLNAIQKKIRKTKPEARLAFLAYFGTLSVPERVKPADGIFLEYAPMEKYVAKGEDREARIAREAEMLEPLLDFFGREDAIVLEYWYDNSMYSYWTKPPKPFRADGEAVFRDIALYRKKGFRRISTFGCFLGPDYEALYGEPDLTAFRKACGN